MFFSFLAKNCILASLNLGDLAKQGDDCLIQVAGALSRTSATWCAQIPQRAGDLVARFGGEEFAAILPNTKSQDALIIAESMRNAISLLGIPHVKSEVSQYITISLGVASIIPGRENSLEDLINKADKALYLAKHQGRNQTFIDHYTSKQKYFEV